MSRVTQFFREKYSNFEDVPEEKLVRFIGDTYPEFFDRDKEFLRDYIKETTTVTPVKAGELEGEETAKDPTIRGGAIGEALSQAVKTDPVLADWAEAWKGPDPEKKKEETKNRMELVTRGIESIDNQAEALKMLSSDNPARLAAAEEFRTEALDNIGVTVPSETPFVRLGVKLPTRLDAQSVQDTTGVSEETAKKISGVQNAVIDGAEFFLTPLGIATLGMGGLPANTQRLISGAFAVEMARHMPDQLIALSEAYKKGDTENVYRLATGAVLTGIFAGKAGKHAIGKTKAQALRGVLKDSAKAINETIKNPEFNLELKEVAKTQALEGTLPKRGGELEGAKIESLDPAVEARWQGAKPVRPGFYKRSKEKAIDAAVSFTRHKVKLIPKEDGAVLDVLRQHEAVPEWSKLAATTKVFEFAEGLNQKGFGLYQRLVILPDIIQDIRAKGIYSADANLPFGYKNVEQMEADLANFKNMASQAPEVLQAVQKRKQFMHQLRDELVSRDLLPKEVKNFEEYYHHQVLAYHAIKRGARSGQIRKTKAGFQKKRIGSEKDYNTDYLESELEVIANSMSQIATQDTLAKLNKIANIRPKLVEQAKIQGKDWKELIPEDHTTWSPVKGNHFYKGTTITEKALESYMKGEKILTEEDFKRALMVGKQAEWVIPKRLAETLDKFTPREDLTIEKFIGAGIGSWKRWTLLNPFRVVKYNLNNLSGDLDIVLAYNPKILGEARKAVVDLKQLHGKKRGAVSQEIQDLTRRGVLGSGWAGQEVTKLKNEQLFATLEGKRPNLIRRYWRRTQDFTQWREDVLRLAAYRHFLREVRAGKKVYGASIRQQVDEIRKTGKPEDVAAKLARELIGDYGNISEAGQWLRRHVIPFYSWMEINTPRYFRLMKNLPHEGRGGRGRGAAVGAWSLGKKATGLAVRASLLYGSVNLWNKTLFADEEAELEESQRRQLHLILGRREDGSIITLRFQGALSDMLGWVGAEDLPQDISDIASGEQTPKEMLTEAWHAPVNRAVNASLPIKKTIVEAWAKQKFFPDLWSPRPVRDRKEHFASLFSLGDVYRWIGGKPMRERTFAQHVGKLVTYTTDPGEAAYYVTRAKVFKWLREQEEPESKFIPGERSNMLYYHKQAIKYGDEELADKFFEKYMDLGGSEKGAAASIKGSEPLGSLDKKQVDEFLDSLTPKQLKTVNRAEKWYDQTFR